MGVWIHGRRTSIDETENSNSEAMRESDGGREAGGARSQQHQVPGSHKKLSIRRIDSRMSAKEKMRITAERNMLQAKHFLPVAQKSIARASMLVRSQKATHEMIANDIKEGMWREQNLKSASQSLLKETKKYHVHWRAKESQCTICQKRY